MVLHGRARECAAIDAVLDDARRSRSGCLVIRGEPGMGKTALLSYAVERARGTRVLTGSGARSESALPFASLHQLLRPVLGHLDAIPALQAAALKGALGMVPAQGSDRFLIALAVLSLFSELSEHLSDLGMGRWPEAMARLEAVVTPHSPESHPMVAILATSDLVETAYRLGRPDLAQAPLARFESFAGPTAAAWTLALVARCRALMCEAETAIGFFDQALAWHAQAGRRFDQARTRLLYAESLRRARRRADARSPLRNAIDTFEQLGASPWQERATAELRATGETARKRQPSTSAALTPQQTQIVRLVAEGATNKEVAAQLFLSPRTVAYHLRNVFVKLGITSRAELIRLQNTDQTAQASR